MISSSVEKMSLLLSSNTKKALTDISAELDIARHLIRPGWETGATTGGGFC
jgi:hypothetical protein